MMRDLNEWIPKIPKIGIFFRSVQIFHNVAKSVVMKITVERKATGQVEAEALIVPVFQGRRDARFGAADLFDSGEVAGKPLELTLLHHPPGYMPPGCCLRERANPRNSTPPRCAA